MGNCIERSGAEEDGVEQEIRALEKAGELRKDKPSGAMRIKIVLTKEELEWLLFQLKKKQGQRLEDVLDEIERGRQRTLGWKPSLESISESPEVPEQMDR